MIKRSVGATVVGGLVVIAAGIASCSFPTYNIIVTGGAGGGATSASVSATASTGEGGGAAATSSGSVGGSGGANASSSSAGGAPSTSTSTSSGTTTSTSSGPCTTDEDADGAVSWQCGGTDCADQDSRAHPGAGFTPGAAIQGLRSPTTLPYDFDCSLAEEKQTVTLSCAGLICPTPVTTHGYQVDTACGTSGSLGHCAGAAPCVFTSDNMSTLEICK